MDVCILYTNNGAVNGGDVESGVMTVVCEIAWAAPDGGNTAGITDRWRQGGAMLPGLCWLDLYEPAAAAGHDPYVHDGPAPMRLAMLAFRARPELDQASGTAVFAELLSGLRAATCTAMEHAAFAVGGEATPEPLTAPFSYVVRYHRPADDEAAFVEHYLAGHPPLLGRLPGIRNVMCYLPLPWQRAGGPPPADYMIGNEVVFNDAASFEAAMASPVRHELRTHYRSLPRFSGRNTHFAMDRVRLVG